MKKNEPAFAGSFSYVSAGLRNGKIDDPGQKNISAPNYLTMLRNRTIM